MATSQAPTDWKRTAPPTEITSKVIATNEKSVVVTFGNEKSLKFEAQDPVSVPAQLTDDKEKEKWNSYSRRITTAITAIKQIEKEFGPLTNSETAGSKKNAPNDLVKFYDELAGAVASIMKVRKDMPCLIKDWFSLRDLRSDMRNSMAKLIIPRFEGNACDELDTILLDVIGLRDDSALLCNLTAGHSRYPKKPDRPWTPQDPYFGVGAHPKKEKNSRDSTGGNTDAGNDSVLSPASSAAGPIATNPTVAPNTVPALAGAIFREILHHFTEEEARAVVDEFFDTSE